MTTKNRVEIDLVTLNDSHLEVILSWHQDPVLAKLRQAKGVPKSIDEVRVWYENIQSNDLVTILLIRRRNDNKLVGYLRLDYHDLNRFEAELGILVATDFRTGIGESAIRSYLGLMNDPKTKIMAKVSRENLASQKLFEKIGFERVDLESYIEYSISTC